MRVDAGTLSVARRVQQSRNGRVPAEPWRLVEIGRTADNGSVLYGWPGESRWHLRRVKVGHFQSQRRRKVRSPELSTTQTPRGSRNVVGPWNAGGAATIVGGSIITPVPGQPLPGRQRHFRRERRGR